MQERITWIAVLRGLNILLVVMYHVQLINLATGECFDFCQQLSYPFNQVRMPLFIFISGGLLYLSRIRKNIPVKSVYADKFQRIMIPFFFFVIVYFLIKALFIGFTKTKVTLSLNYFLESFIYFHGHPSAPLWFLAVLMMFMLLYPLYCYLDRKPLQMVIFLVFTAVIYFVNLNFDDYWNVFYILNINYYLVYFLFGIFYFKFEIYKYLSSVPALLLLIIGYSVTYIYDVPLLCSLIGIMMMCSLCMQLAKILPNLFHSFREYIFQIYLMSLPFQGFIELVVWKRLFYQEDLVFLFYILNVVSGITIPVIIAKSVNRCPVKIVRLCFGLS